MSISQCLDHIIGAVRIKVLEVKKNSIDNWMYLVSLRNLFTGNIPSNTPSHIPSHYKCMCAWNCGHWTFLILSGHTL